MLVWCSYLFSFVIRLQALCLFLVISVFSIKVCQLDCRSFEMIFISSSPVEIGLASKGSLSNSCWYLKYRSRDFGARPGI